MADFRDRSCSDSSWDFSAFVRTYARYVDEKLNHRMRGKSRAIKWQTPAKLFEQDEEEDHCEVGTPSKASF
ncbi:hypothetical protein HPP92_004549 [Vanilla planifolia]|nr:hypothetical protein HPP92_004549 [Vanilla planifolia]